MHFTNETVLENWLIQWEKEEVIRRLLASNIILYSNERNLRLKSGGFTDIYVNLRDGRHDPKLLRFISNKYTTAIKRLGANLIGEIPHGISCYAPMIAEEADLPFITFREKEKKGRVTSGSIIGHYNYGDSISIVDDVITDGGSKLKPYKQCLKLGLDVLPLIVLVDRQQGWRKTFQKLGINTCVWSAMTLHDIRRFLITESLMQRCRPENEEKNPIILAIDNKNWEETLSLVDPLRNSGCILKVNDVVFNEGIKNLLPNLQVYGRVMVDMKSHDIPNTVSNITKHVKPHNPWAVTVHGSGGEQMIKAAVNTLIGTDTKILAVTVLTSMDSHTCEEVYNRQPWEQVRKIAEMAHRAGAQGIVCSPEEVTDLKRLYPEMTLVTPGIRSNGTAKGDQSRIATPAKAMENGATNIVMGRQITEADDPIAEVYRVLKEELKISLS